MEGFFSSFFLIVTPFLLELSSLLDAIDETLLSAKEKLEESLEVQLERAHWQSVVFVSHLITRTIGEVEVEVGVEVEVRRKR